jgi:hypothetical protein
MSPLQSTEFGLDVFRAGPPPSLGEVVARRWGGRYALDPFGLDPQLCDLVAPIGRRLVPVTVVDAHRVPAGGAAVLVYNRGLGIGEPAALATGVQQETGRRVRFVAGLELGPLTSLVRRFGAVGRHPTDLAGLLRAGHLAAVPLSPTWLKTEAGRPPLDLCAAMLGYPVFPVAVVPVCRFGVPTPRFEVRVGERVVVDGSYPPGDPLGAAELGDASRDAVQAMLAGRAAPTAGAAPRSS